MQRILMVPWRLAAGLSCGRVESLTMAKPKPPGTPIFAGDELQGAGLLHYVKPKHPADADVHGAVEFRAKVDKERRIENLTLV